MFNKSIFNEILNLIFPQKCVLCKAYGSAICADCMAKIELDSKFACGACGNLPVLCGCKKIPNIRRVFYPYFYCGDELIRALYCFKRRNNRALCDAFAEVLADALRTESVLCNDGAVITYVPRSPVAAREFGYDQAKQLAEALGRRLSVRVVPLLKCMGGSLQQKTLSADERSENVRGKYSLTGQGVPECVILVDDVITTGSTIKECAAVLTAGGVADILAVSIAGTPVRGK